MDLKAIHQKLLVSGEKDRLKEHLRIRLVESGWTKQVTQKINELIQEQGLDHVTAESLTSDVLNEAIAMVPKIVRQEIYQQLQTFLDQELNIPNLN